MESGLFYGVLRKIDDFSDEELEQITEAHETMMSEDEIIIGPKPGVIINSLRRLNGVWPIEGQPFSFENQPARHYLYADWTEPSAIELVYGAEINPRWRIPWHHQQRWGQHQSAATHWWLDQQNFPKPNKNGKAWLKTVKAFYHAHGWPAKPWVVAEAVEAPMSACFWWCPPRQSAPMAACAWKCPQNCPKPTSGIANWRPLRRLACNSSKRLAGG
jgi:hypothetical protein